jgi:poly-gamma-glutamate synthesis protein (capsule biosynthesis protein)
MRSYRSRGLLFIACLLLAPGALLGACASDPEAEAGRTAAPVVTAPDPTPSAAGEAAAPPPGAPEPVIELIFGGDVMLGRSLGEGILAYGTGYPFEFVAPLLSAAGLAFVNLEAPITERGQAAEKDFVFRAPPAAARSLAEAGLDVVSLANNHMLDYGLEGLFDTMSYLDRAGVKHAGAGAGEAAARTPLVIEADGVRLAFLAYVNTPSDSLSGFSVAATAAGPDKPGVAWLTPESVREDVSRVAGSVDAVIVSMHAGPEYQEEPGPLQAAAARAAIDAGARLVIGHHPHVLQGIERYGDGLIVYSLGNFVFDFDHVDYLYPGLPSRLSALLRVRLAKSGGFECEVAPLIIGEGDGRPRPVTGPEADPVLERLRRLSDGSCGLGS